MAQHDFTIANGDGATVRADLQAALQALATVNAGAAEPATMYANMLMYSTALAGYVRRNNGNSAWLTLFAPVAQGRLTLESGVPLSMSDQTAKTTVYYTPDVGNFISLYDPTLAAWIMVSFNETSIKLTDSQAGATTNGSANVTGLTDTSGLAVGMEVTGTGIAGGTTIAAIPSATTITLSANATATGTPTLTFKAPANKLYDVFGYNSAGVLKLELLAWTNDTTRATALVRTNGVRTKSGDASRRFLGMVRTTSTAGQTEFSAAKRLLVNENNRRMLFCSNVIDSSAVAITSTSAVELSVAANRVGFLALSDGFIEASLRATASNNGSGNTTRASVRIDGVAITDGGASFSTAAANQSAALYAHLHAAQTQPVEGYHYASAWGLATAGTANFNGGAAGEFLASIVSVRFMG